MDALETVSPIAYIVVTSMLSLVLTIPLLAHLIVCQAAERAIDGDSDSSDTDENSACSYSESEDSCPEVEEISDSDSDKDEDGSLSPRTRFRDIFNYFENGARDIPVLRT